LSLTTYHDWSMGLWKRILAATAFNLLFEYSMRGANNLRVQPILPLILFTTYFSLFGMIEDLIARYRLKDYHLMVMVFSFGIIYQCFVSGAAFSPPLFLGINWRSVFFVILVWWGALQTVMTFYLANRIMPRDWSRQPLSKMTWVALLSLNTSMILLFQLSGRIPRGTVMGVVMMLLVFLLSVALFLKIIPRSQERQTVPEFKRIRVMNYLTGLSVLIFIICAVFLTFDPTQYVASNVNRTATSVVVSWSILSALIMLGYRLHSKKPIPV